MDVVPPYSTYNKDPKNRTSYQVYLRVNIFDYCPIDNLGHNRTLMDQVALLSYNLSFL